MKYSLSILFALLALSCSAKTSSENDLDPRYNRLHIGPQAYYLRLRTGGSSTPGIFGRDTNAKLDGPLGGIIAKYEYSKMHSLYAGLLGQWAMGTITNSSFPDRKIQDASAEGRIGYNYIPMQGNRFVITPYLGWGFQYQRQKRDATPSVKFIYLRYYIPIGFLLDFKAYDFLHLGFNFEWLPDIDPTLRINTLPGARWNLQHRYGLEVELPLQFLLGSKKSVEITLIPFWRRTKTGRTMQTTPGGLPLDVTRQVLIYWGAKLAIGGYF